MTTSAANESDIVLSERAGDPRRVRAILADWGLDAATISRMLSEQTEGTIEPSADDFRNTPGSHIPSRNSDAGRGSGLHA